MPKIVKNSDAPEGKIEVVYAGGEFTVDGRGFKTDDPDALAAARRFDFLDVEEADEADPAALRAAAEADAKERFEVEEAERKRAEKDQMAPAPAKSIPGQRTEETAQENKN